jgi:hypothetical protein
MCGKRIDWNMPLSPPFSLPTSARGELDMLYVYSARNPATKEWQIQAICLQRFLNHNGALFPPETFTDDTGTGSTARPESSDI